MSMENLVGISLERLEPDPAMIKRLLEAAERNIADAENKGSQYIIRLN